MKILGKEIDFDFFDADEMEKAEKAIEKFQEKGKKLNITKSQKSSDIIRKTCYLIFELFDDVLGEGIHKEIFGEKTSLSLCRKAFEDLVNEKKKAENEFEEISNVYSTNRVQRRSKK